MKRCFTKRNAVISGGCCLVVFIVLLRVVSAAEKLAGYDEGLKCYNNNEPDKAINIFKKTLAEVFPAQGAGEPQEDEKALLSHLDDDKTAALANYKLGLIYEAQGKLDKAAAMFSNAISVISGKEARYEGVKSCKACHFKEWISWKKTKMAKTFEILKPGVNTEAKTKLKFDPQKDYTKDPKCLGCHTTGFGLPGGYRIPQAGDSKSQKTAKENEGVGCEACHGPGSRYIAVHKDILDNNRSYTFDELSKIGQMKPDRSVCITCHNRRNPTAVADYHFDYEKYKAEDTHENVPLKYRQKE